MRSCPAPRPPELADLFKPHTRGARLLNDPGATALMFATAYGHNDAMTLLISAKANREARTRSGLRPLDLAAERGDIDAMQALIGVTPGSEAAHLSIVVDLDKQKAVLSRDGVPILTTGVSSGKKEKPTPPGKYVVTQKYTEWRSTLYHNAKMPFFLRLSCSPVGLHAGVIAWLSRFARLRAAAAGGRAQALRHDPARHPRGNPCFGRRREPAREKQHRDHEADRGQSVSAYPIRGCFACSHGTPLPCPVSSADTATECRGYKGVIRMRVRARRKIPRIRPCGGWPIRQQCRALPMASPLLYLQLWSLRHETATDPANTLRQVRALGYDGVELAGDYGWSAAQWRERLDATTRLTVVSAHTGPGCVGNRPICQNAGLSTARSACRRLAVSSLPKEMQTTNGYRDAARRLDAVGRKLADEGFTLGYHNHDFEFAPLDGSGSPCGMDILLAGTDPALVGFEFDAFWLEYAGRDALEFICHHEDRVFAIHAKDLRKHDRKDVPAGQGDVDFRSLRADGHRHGLAGHRGIRGCRRPGSRAAGRRVPASLARVRRGFFAPWKSPFPRPRRGRAAPRVARPVPGQLHDPVF